MGAYGWFAKLGSLLGVLVTRVWYCFRELPISEHTRETSSALTRRRTRVGNDKLTNTSCIYIYIYIALTLLYVCVGYIHIYIYTYSSIQWYTTFQYSVNRPNIILQHHETALPTPGSGLLLCEIHEYGRAAHHQEWTNIIQHNNEDCQSVAITGADFQIPPSSTTLNLPCARWQSSRRSPCSTTCIV